MMIYLAADHRGLLKKDEIKKFLDGVKLEVADCGNDHLDLGDNAGDFVLRACQLIRADSPDLGIFFCGSGVMVDVVANRHGHIRSCLAINDNQIKAARNDDNVNVLSIAADYFSTAEVISLVSSFISTGFSNTEPYLSRLASLKALPS